MRARGKGGDGQSGHWGATRAVLTWAAHTLGRKWQAPGGDLWAEEPATARKGGAKTPSPKEARPGPVGRPAGAAAVDGRAAVTLGAEKGRPAGGVAGWLLLGVGGSSGGRGRGLGSRAGPCTHNAGEVGVLRVRHGGGEAGLGGR